MGIIYPVSPPPVAAEGEGAVSKEIDHSGTDESGSPYAPERPRFGLTPEQSMWLSYYIGQCLYTSGEVTSGRDIMRVLHARWAQMGLPEETMADFDRAILRDDSPLLLSTPEVQRRAIRVLAGDCPIGPIERLA